MNKGNKISFIPQKPISRKVKSSARPLSLVLSLSFAVFFLTFAVYGGMFFYNNDLKKLAGSKQLELSSAKQKLDPGDAIGRAQEFQKKINDVKNILDSHIAPSVLFSLLEDITLKSVSFSAFKFTEGNDNISNQNIKTNANSSYSVSLKGTAPGYSSVAYQTDIIKEEIEKRNRIESFSISDISLNEMGNVTFSIEFSPSPSFLIYRDVIRRTHTSNENVEQINSEDTSSLDDLDFEELDVIFNENE